MIEDLSVLSRKGNHPDLTLSYGDSPDQVADIRYAESGATRPLLVLLHGGFWKPAFDRAHTAAMSSALAAAGWTVLTLEYRRIPGSPDATLDDVRLAVATFPARVTQHNGKLILLGHSAGGHLALWAAATCGISALSGVVVLAPAADLSLSHQLRLGGDAVSKFLGTDPVERPDADPMQLRQLDVPVTILHGDADEVVPLVVAKSYHSAFPLTRLVKLPGAGHYDLIDPRSGAWSSVVDELKRVSEVG